MHVVRRLRPRHVGSSAAGLTRESVSGGTPRHGSAAHRRTRALARRRGEGAPHPLRQGGQRLRLRSPRSTSAGIVVQELVQRADIDPAEIDQLVFGQVIPTLTRPAHRARGGARLGAAAEDRGPHRGARLRHLHPGDDRRGQRHRARRSGRRHRRRHRVHVATSPIFTSRPLAQRAGAGRRARRRSPRSSAPFQKLKPKDLRPGPARHRRVLHRPDHGRERGEDGQGERHLPRGAGRDRPRLAPATPRAAWKEGRVRRRGDARAGAADASRRSADQGQHRPRGHLASRRSSSSSRCSTASTAPSPPGNASPLTDGAAALLLMSEEKAKALGLRAARASCAPTPTPPRTRPISSCRARPTRRPSRSSARA